MPRQRPSERWTSYEDWDYGTMKQRLESFMASLDKMALVDHVEAVLGSPVFMSEPFSAGQYWCCFECVAPDSDGRLVIARVRLPRHPDSKASDHDEAYIMQCEAAAMAFLRHSVTAIPFPTLYAYEAPGSARAAKAGAPYMLIEGFYGNLLQDVDHSVCNLPVCSAIRDCFDDIHVPHKGMLTFPSRRHKTASLASELRSRHSLQRSPFPRSAPYHTFLKTADLSSTPWLPQRQTASPTLDPFLPQRYTSQPLPKLASTGQSSTRTPRTSPASACSPSRYRMQHRHLQP